MISSASAPPTREFSKRSAGQYGDLGQYSVRATGTILREAVASIRLDDPEMPGYDEVKLTFDELDSAWTRMAAVSCPSSCSPMPVALVP